MIEVVDANETDLASLVAFESALFREDADRYGTFADVSWPEREGAADFRRLMATPSCMVIVARIGEVPVGHLVGYLSGAPPTRQPITSAVLRSLYVAEDHRTLGIAKQLTQHFLSWAKERGCAEAHVECYSANAPALALYGSLGFAPQSVSLILPI